MSSPDTPLFALARPRGACRFLQAETGALSVEAAIIMPVLAALYVAGFSYFDGYRREAAAQRASYTMGDLLSRKIDSSVTPQQLDGLQRLYETLTFSEDRSWFRVSELQRKDDDVEVVWSFASSGNPSLTNARLMQYLDRVPTLDDNERVVTVETFTHYDSFGDMGVEDRIFDNFVATRQRYWPQLVLDMSDMPEEIETLSSGACPGFATYGDQFTRVAFSFTQGGEVACGMAPQPVADVTDDDAGQSGGSHGNFDDDDDDD